MPRNLLTTLVVIIVVVIGGYVLLKDRLPAQLTRNETPQTSAPISQPVSGPYANFVNKYREMSILSDEIAAKLPSSILAEENVAESSQSVSQLLAVRKKECALIPEAEAKLSDFKKKTPELKETASRIADTEIMKTALSIADTADKWPGLYEPIIPIYKKACQASVNELNFLVQTGFSPTNTAWPDRYADTWINNYKTPQRNIVINELLPVVTPLMEKYTKISDTHMISIEKFIELTKITIKPLASPGLSEQDFGSITTGD